MKDGMVDLKLTKADREKLNSLGPQPVRDNDGPEYPYGLSISIDTDLIKKLGIEAMEVGDTVMVHAMGKVVRKSVTEKGDSDKATSIEIQLQQMSIETEEDAGKKMRKDIANEVFAD